jgi:hypothetical protein
MYEVHSLACEGRAFPSTQTGVRGGVDERSVALRHCRGDGVDLLDRRDWAFRLFSMSWGA